MSNPLINDYIKKDSRGKAVALMGVGTLAGECFCVVVLLTLTKKMDLVQGFDVASLILLIMSLPVIYFVTKPIIKAKVA